MSGKRVAVIHYMPLEIYPPVMNLIRCWDNGNTANQMDVYTTSPEHSMRFSPSSGTIHIKRLGVSGKKRRFLSGLLHYCYYYLGTLYGLIKTRPANVLYFDTISSFPAIVYKNVFKRNCRLFIHYNEYMSPEEYRHGMLLVKQFHKWEKKNYKKANWLSHTNQERMDLFTADLPGITIPNKYILPNYPPANWAFDKTGTIEWPVKIVYTGAVSMDSMYLQLFAEWILKHKGAINWDIYSLNITEDAKDYIQKLPGNIIRLHNGVDYYHLPEILKKYHVGVILYKGHIPNYIFNAPNKLFEYATCGLDVWFPDHMQSSTQYITMRTYPKITALNFQQLGEVKVDELISRDGCKFQHAAFACETVLTPLLQKLAG